MSHQSSLLNVDYVHKLSSTTTRTGKGTCSNHIEDYNVAEKFGVGILDADSDRIDINSNIGSEKNDHARSTPNSSRTSTAAPPSQVLQQRQHEHDQRLVQILQYIATMSMTASNSSTTAASEIVSSATTGGGSSTSAIHHRKKTVALEKVSSSVSETDPSPSSSSAMFVKQFTTPSNPPPFFYYHDSMIQQQQYHPITSSSSSSSPDRITSTHSKLIPHKHQLIDRNSNMNNGNILFTTETFRRLYKYYSSTESKNVSGNQRHVKLPFTFYGVSPASSGTSKATTSSSANSIVSDPVCWLRLTRLSSSTTTSNSNDFTPQQQAALLYEPIYNRLFEYIQQRQQNDDEHTELMWGFGNGSLTSPSTTTSTITTVVNGPLFEVPMEVELGSTDGAIYLRPKQSVVGGTSNTSGSGGSSGGIRINRDVLSSLLRNGTSRQSNTTSSSNVDAIITTWFRKVIQEQNIDLIAQLSPAQPDTFTAILQQVTMELFSNAVYISSDKLDSSEKSPNRVVITDAWCLYISSKPSSVLARDALAFVDRIENRKNKQTIQQSSCPADIVLPSATWAITHGPGSYERYIRELDDECNRKQGNAFATFFRSILFKQENTTVYRNKLNTISSNLPPRISLPLPSTDVQYRIVDMLLYQNYPCVVVEGPPGTGKSQTICNMICAYLRVGKRVLVTSKHASSLSVIRKRLPKKSIQELCIDVSNSESNGVRHLQQTVERLSNRLANSTHQHQLHDESVYKSSSTASSASVGSIVDVEKEKLRTIQDLIDEHERELMRIEETISLHRKRIYEVVQSEDGQLYIKIAMELLDSMRWLMSTISKWTPYNVKQLRDRIEPFVLLTHDGVVAEEGIVCGYNNPPSNGLISLAASYAKEQIHVASVTTKKMMAGIPMIGSWVGMDHYVASLEVEVRNIRIGGRVPNTADEWKVVVRALRRAQALYQFGQGEWATYERKDSWPNAHQFFANHENLNLLYANLCKAVQMKNLEWKLNIRDVMATSLRCQSLIEKRCTLSSRIQELSQELINLTVLTELCRSLSEEALSALIRFSQIAGKAKFHKPSTALAKMSLRQRRHRQDYLEAFDRCCRYIPCWILTTSQISDYLPPECIFDLVIIDETSQSDITVLPTMLRGKQWLIVGDGKQVSPTESFISEEQMENLRATIPQCYFESSLLPGQSFFDLCAQAFPSSRVVLNEHFRCASEIIAFSNEQFYDNQLIPLRLPTPSERITPSIVDVLIPNGTKVGKINEGEANEIVRRVEEIVKSNDRSQRHRRSIGIISLMGDEQSRLIRGRLLDTIGPQLMAQHSILVGDPPSFQGTERDIIFLSMVCSKGRAPTQSQLVHFQRANVALSRARDQCLLIRSLSISDIPNTDDVKIPIIEFFQSASTSDPGMSLDVAVYDKLMNCKNLLRRLLARRLHEKGYKICCMGVVLKDGICVEHPESDVRVALIIDDISETNQDWCSSYQQQQKIEGVGWSCLRVDILSLLSDCNGTMHMVFQFLKQAGITLDDTKSDTSRVNERTADNTETEGEIKNSIAKAYASSSSSDDLRNLSASDLNISDKKKRKAPIASRSIKRSRSSRQNIIRSVETSDDADDYDDEGREGTESLVSQDSSFNGGGNVVVDLSFLRGNG